MILKQEKAKKRPGSKADNFSAGFCFFPPVFVFFLISLFFCLFLFFVFRFIPLFQFYSVFQF